MDKSNNRKVGQISPAEAACFAEQTKCAPEYTSGRNSESIAGAYVHIPFCSHKCDFCDFAAVAGLDHLEDEYFEVLLREIAERLSLIDSEISLSTIFFGGGTPGLAKPDNVRKVLEKLLEKSDESVVLAQSCEISLETTPHAIDLAKAEKWLDMGINRLSIGVESLDDNELRAIGRDHDLAAALEGIELACRAGFENISIDLMYGLPTQTETSWSKTLDALERLIVKRGEIKHLSAYGLELTDNSPLYSRFARNSPHYPDEMVFERMYQLLVERLESLGFEHYEVSNFAMPDYRCRHNMIYWHNRPYLAFGVGAHRYVDGVRSANWKSLKKYMRDYLGEESHECIDPETRMKEGIILGLRLREGIDLELFEKIHGVDLKARYPVLIERLIDSGHLLESEGRLSLSKSAVPISNSILSEFM